MGQQMFADTDRTVARDLETALFGWDADLATRQADAFVRGEVRQLSPVRGGSVCDPPEFPGAYAKRGGETVVVRANDAALALARHARAA